MCSTLQGAGTCGQPEPPCMQSCGAGRRQRIIGLNVWEAIHGFDPKPSICKPQWTGSSGCRPTPPKHWRFWGVSVCLAWMDQAIVMHPHGKTYLRCQEWQSGQYQECPPTKAPSCLADANTAASAVADGSSTSWRRAHNTVLSE